MDKIQELNRYQYAAKSYCLPQAYAPEYLFAGLGGEVGEVLSLHAKAVRDYTEAGVFLDSLRKELGDCLWFISLLADYHGFTLSEIATENIDKLDSRKNRGTIQGAGNDR